MDISEDFRTYLTVQRHAANSTKETYSREAACFLSFLEKNNLSLKDVAREDIEVYLQDRKKTQKSSRTTARTLTTLRVFFAYLYERKIRLDDPTSLIGHIKTAKTVPQVLSVNEIDCLLESIGLDDYVGFRDKTIFELIYSCGLRVSECVDMKLEDFLAREKRIKVTGKGNKQRLIPVGERAFLLLDEYVKNWRPSVAKSCREKILFLTVKGNKMTRQDVWERLKYWSEKAGIKSKVHTLRHSFATDLIKNGADLRSVQELMGHSDIRTTEIYTHINTQDLQKEHKKHLPDI